MNVDETAKSLVKFGIRSILPLILFKNGQLAATVVGAMSKGPADSLHRPTIGLMRRRRPKARSASVLYASAMPRGRHCATAQDPAFFPVIISLPDHRFARIGNRPEISQARPDCQQQLPWHQPHSPKIPTYSAKELFSMHLNELKALHVLKSQQAEELEIENTGRMRKQELMFAIIKKRAKRANRCCGWRAGNPARWLRLAQP